MSFWARQSIAVKLPLAFAFVLLVLGTAMGVVSYLEVRQTVVRIAAERLQQAATQMAIVLGTSGGQRIAAMRQFISRPEVAEYLRTRDSAQADAIAAAARAYLGSTIQIANVEIWDAAGTRRLATGAPFSEATGATLEDHKREVLAADVVIGRLRVDGDEVLYPVGGRVTRDGAMLGYVIERRRISNPSQTQQTIQLLTGLIGGRASIVVGNADGTSWSDLTQAVSGIPITQGDSERLWQYERPGMPPVLAWAKPIPSTPWLVAIEFPRREVMAPADRLVRRASVIAFTLLLVAAVIGWAFSRRITTPLREVTEAAEALADSGHARHLDIDRHDEVGRLADSFNTMAEKVEQARRDLEQQVDHRTAELSAANRELEAFSYSVSHDLRAPLRAIAGFVQILEDDHGGSFNPEARRSLERVKANATRMGQLIDDLLSLSRVGRLPLSWRPVDLNAIARAAADDAIAAVRHQIDLAIEPLPPCVGEPVLLTQVFANLISNAVKFTARAEHASITIGSMTNGETVYFVRDNGAGFDERYAEKLFGVFQRLHHAADFEGTGVGLAIVHRIITRHGGRVWAEGKPNEGATFYFTVGSREA